MELVITRKTCKIIVTPGGGGTSPRAVLVSDRKDMDGMKGIVFTASAISYNHFMSKYSQTGVIQFTGGNVALTAEESAEIDKMQAKYDNSPSEVAAREKGKALRAEALKYQRNENEGGEGYNPYIR